MVRVLTSHARAGGSSYETRAPELVLKVILGSAGLGKYDCSKHENFDLRRFICYLQ